MGFPEVGREIRSNWWAGVLKGLRVNPYALQVIDRDNFVFNGILHQFCGVSESQFLKNMTFVRLHGLDANEQGFGQ